MATEIEIKEHSEKHKYDNVFYEGKFIKDFLDLDVDESLRKEINEFLKKKIYRIESFERVKKLLQNKELVLVKPEKWDDPYENFFLKGNAITKSGELVSLENIKKYWYGQCWTLKEESDAMWRIYSPNKDGIRITTTVGRLFDAIYDTKKFPSAHLQFFIGQVEYVKLEEIQEIIEKDTFQERATGGDDKGFADLLMIKRDAFSHEEEVRILADKLPSESPWNKYSEEDPSISKDENEKDINKNIDENNDLWKFEVNIRELLLGNLYLDPRLDKNEFEKYCGVLREEINKKNLCLNIEQSELYKFVEEPIKLY